MQVSASLKIKGARVVREIGRISAASRWHGHQCGSSDQYRNQALDALIATAKEYEADAIIGLDYAIDDTHDIDLTDIPRERTAVTGIAVKISHN